MSFEVLVIFVIVLKLEEKELTQN